MLVSVLVSVLFLQAFAHAPGAQYTYLSMFLHPEDEEQNFKPEKLYGSYETKPSAAIAHSRRLQHVSETQDKFLNDGDEDDFSSASYQTPSPTITPPVRQKLSDDRSSASTEVDDTPFNNLATLYGEDTERLVSMVAKLVGRYHITSIVDVPCRAHAHWVPDLLQSLPPANKVRYTCVDTNSRVLNLLKAHLAEKDLLNGVDFLVRRFWKDDLPKADLVLSWSGLDNMALEHIGAYFDRLAHSGNQHKFVILGTHPGKLLSSGDPHLIARFTGRGKPINVRKAPFHLSKPFRIIKDLSKDGNDKQMYVYVPDHMLS